MRQKKDLLIGYLHNTLTSAQKSHVEGWLRDSPAAYEYLSDIRQTQEQIKHDLCTHLDSQPIPSSMTFDVVSRRLYSKKKQATTDFRTRWVTSFAGLAALFFLSYALIYSMGGDISQESDQDNQYGNAFIITTTPLFDQKDNDDITTIPTSTPLFPTVIPNSSIPTRRFDS